jgi:hypothetical protein
MARHDLGRSVNLESDVARTRLAVAGAAVARQEVTNGLRAGASIPRGADSQAIARTMVAQEGGNGALARALGYTPGTKGYSAALRSIERHLDGTRGIGKAWRDQYLALARGDQNQGMQNLLLTGDRNRTPDIPGSVSIGYTGTVRISRDSRYRSIPEHDIDSSYALYALLNPAEALGIAYEIGPDWSGSGDISITYQS